MPPRNRYAPLEPPPDDMAPVLDWEVFRQEFLWKQNQHLGIVGPTEQGKTNLVYHLLDQRDYVVYPAHVPAGLAVAVQGLALGFDRQVDDVGPLVPQAVDQVGLALPGGADDAPALALPSQEL